MSDNDVLVGNKTLLAVGGGAVPPVGGHFVQEKQHVTLVKRQLATGARLEIVYGQRLFSRCSQFTHAGNSHRLF